MVDKKVTAWVNYAKAIGIVLVVYGHVVRGLVKSGIEMPEYLYYLVDSIIYSFHMPLFFFLSGLFFCKSLNKYGGKGLIFTKLDTIIYPYIIWSLLQGSIEVTLSNFTNGNVSWGYVFKLLWAPRAHFWFLYALFFVFLAAVVICSTKAKKHTEVIFTLSVILYLLPPVLPTFRIFTFISEYSIYFYFGIVFQKHVKVEYLKSSQAVLILLIMFLLGQWLFHGHFLLTYQDKGWGTLLLALISIVFVVSVSVQLSTRSYSAIEFVGISSMGIYLMHILAGSGTRIVLSKLLNVDSYILHIMVGTIVGILFPIIAIKLISKFNIPYVFSAPTSAWGATIYNKVTHKD